MENILRIDLIARGIDALLLGNKQMPKGYLMRYTGDGNTEMISAAQIDVNKRTLLLIHGTVATAKGTFGSFGICYNPHQRDKNRQRGLENGKNRFGHPFVLDRLMRAEGGYEQILAFNHPTLSQSLRGNIRDLMSLLPEKPFAQPVDIISGSRGCQIARYLATYNNTPDYTGELINTKIKAGRVAFLSYAGESAVLDIMENPGERIKVGVNIIKEALLDIFDGDDEKEWFQALAGGILASTLGRLVSDAYRKGNLPGLYCMDWHFYLENGQPARSATGFWLENTKPMPPAILFPVVGQIRDAQDIRAVHLSSNTFRESLTVQLPVLQKDIFKNQPSDLVIAVARQQSNFVQQKAGPESRIWQKANLTPIVGLHGRYPDMPYHDGKSVKDVVGDFLREGFTPAMPISTTPPVV